MNGTQSVAIVIAQAIIALATIVAITVLVALGKLDPAAGIAVIGSELGGATALGTLVIHRQTPNLAKLPPAEIVAVAKATKAV